MCSFPFHPKIKIVILSEAKDLLFGRSSSSAAGE
jgi:hypothetical protein